MVVFRIVMSNHEGGLGFGLGSSPSIEPDYERIREFISLEVTHSVLDQTPMIFGVVKEGITKLLDGHLGAFRAEIEVGQLGVHRELEAFGALESFMEKNLIASPCLEGSNVVDASCISGGSIP